ncbi:MAG: BsuPI-related putative proteinase inhibitor [Halobacteriaceae archaeon]
MSLSGTLSVQPDDSVEFTFRLTNTGPDPVTLTFPSGLIVDFSVSDGTEEIWRWSENKMVIQAIQTRTVDPNQPLEESAVWKDPVLGSYTATATLQARDVDVTAQQQFEI